MTASCLHDSLPRRKSAPLAAALAAALVFGAPLAAQEQNGQDDLQLDMGTPVGEDAGAAETPLGQPYILEVSTDWEVRCVRTQLEHDPCALHQVLQDQQGNSVATIELVNLPGGQDAEAGATIVTPLETLLTRQLTLSIDGGSARQYPFSFCTEQGCVARVGFTPAEVDAFRRGAVARLTIYPAGAPDTAVELDASLSGFTAGFERLTELNALNAEAVAAARAAQQEQQGDNQTAE
jgi:invasion protein IalB